MRTKYREFFPALFVKTTDFPFVLNFEQTRAVRRDITVVVFFFGGGGMMNDVDLGRIIN